MFKKVLLGMGLALTATAVIMSTDITNAKTKAPNLIGKKSVTVGKSTTLQVKANGTTIKKVTWKSSNKKIATAKAKGKLKCKITGVKNGKATITATVSYKSGKKSATKKLKWKVMVKKSNSKKTSNKINLNHTYVTRTKEVYSVSCPTFQFNYSDNWSVVSEELCQDDTWDEKVVLENSRGATITYSDYATKYGLGGGGRFMGQMKVSKVAASSFVPTYPDGCAEDYSSLGNFMVAKAKIVGSLYMDQDTDFTPVDGGTYYTVVPESYVGEHCPVGLTGIYMACTFEYPSLYSIIAEAPDDGKFTAEEEEEIIAILSTFREK